MPNLDRFSNRYAPFYSIAANAAASCAPGWAGAGGASAGDASVERRARSWVGGHGVVGVEGWELPTYPGGPSGCLSHLPTYLHPLHTCPKLRRLRKDQTLVVMEGGWRYEVCTAQNFE